MATEDRRSDPSLEETLFSEAFRFNFFQAVRLLEGVYPKRRAVGSNSRPAEEVVRFRSHVALAFPPSEIDQIEPPCDGKGAARMTATFMGLAGLQGALPRHYTETILERERQHDHVLRDFLDIFNHRLISLFYRAWQKYRFQIGYERAARKRGEYDPFSLALFDLVGMGTGGLRGRLEFGDEALLFYTGLLAQHPRSATALVNIISDYFEVRVEITQFVGQWLEITPENRTKLGGANHSLGESAVAGTRTWDQQAKFKLRVGPLSYPEFERFLPCGDAYPPFIAMTRYCSGQEFDFDVQLVLRAPEVPWCRLGDERARLGFSTWLKTVEYDADADQVVFSGGLTKIGALPE